MLLRLFWNKKGGGQLFAFFTILFIAGAIWAYFLVYVPAVEERFSKSSEIKTLIGEAESFLTQNDYLNAIEVLNEAKKLENLKPVNVDTLKYLEAQAIALEFHTGLMKAQDLSNEGSLEESNELLKALKTRLNTDSDLKIASTSENLKKIEKLESRNRTKELGFLIDEIVKLIKRELFSDVERKIREAYAKIETAGKFKDFEKDEYVKKLKELERKKEQLSIEDTVGEIDLLITSDVHAEAYQKIRSLVDSVSKETLKQRLQNLRQICEEKLSADIIIDAQSLAKSGDFQKALEVLKLADVYEFQSEKVTENIEDARTEIIAKIEAMTGEANTMIAQASAQLDNKQYSEALKTLVEINPAQILQKEQAQEIAKIRSKANIHLVYERTKYNKDAFYVNNFITLEIITSSGEEYFGAMFKEDYQLVKFAGKESTANKSIKVLLITFSFYDPQRQYILFEVSEIADVTTFSVSEIDEKMFLKEMQYRQDSLIFNYDASEAFKLAQFIKLTSEKSDYTDTADALVEEALNKDPFLWQTHMLRKSEFFKTCVTHILQSDATFAQSAFNTLLKLYPYADVLRENDKMSVNERFNKFKQKILDNADTFGKTSISENLVQFNAFQKKLVKNDETGIINYADTAYSLAMQNLKNFNNYNAASARQLGISEYYSRLALQMLLKAKSKGAVVDSKISEILKKLYLIKILGEY